MLSSASCRDHPRIPKDASEPHRAFGAYSAELGGSLACSTIGARLPGNVRNASSQFRGMGHLPCIVLRQAGSQVVGDANLEGLGI